MTETKHSDAPEWIIQRCTQQWIGTELQYEDFPGYSERLYTYDEMLEKLAECNRQFPDEFRGHNVVNTREPWPRPEPLSPPTPHKPR